jgi:hypothetical protein
MVLMSRTLFAALTAAMMLGAAIAPNAAMAKGVGKQSREESAIWPIQQTPKVFVDHDTGCVSREVKVRNYGPGSDYVWVRKVFCY